MSPSSGADFVAKRAVNLSLNARLVDKARAAGLNLSALAEGALMQALARLERAGFEAEMVQACAEHAAYLAEYGSLGDAVGAYSGAE